MKTSFASLPVLLLLASGCHAEASLTLGGESDSGALDDGASDTADGSETAADDGGDTADTADSGDVGDASGTASLDSLKVEELALSPAFSPDTHDYVVRCAAGGSSLTVTATAADGVAISVAKSPVASGDPASVDVVENDAIVVEAARGDAKSSYWIRCLPHDFPALSVSRPRTPSPGYYLTGNTVLGAGEAGFVMALDTNGTPVWYRRTGIGAGYVTANGKDRVIYSPVLGPTFGVDPKGAWTTLDLASGATSSITAVPGPTDHHEVLPIASGHFLVQSYPRRTGFDLSSRGSSTTDIADCEIQDVAPDGTVVWVWLASDHFDVAKESTFLEEHTDLGAPLVDGFHCNSIDVFPDGDLLVSARHMDAIFRVSRSTGKVVWKLGGVASNKDGAQLLTLADDPTGGFHRQHDARVLPSGEVSMFDNHGPAVGPARALHLAIDTTAGTGTITWSYDGPAGSGAMGSNRLLDDGAHVIGWGMIGVTPAIAFTEIDSTKATVLEVSFPGGSRAYRALKVPTDAFDLDVLRAAVTAK
ncbi:MAG: aryl-sulfate sulfotransferase [Polyangiales bacterium]